MIKEIYDAFLKKVKKEENPKMERVTLIDKIEYKKANSKLNMQKIKDLTLISSAIVLIVIGYVNFSNNNNPKNDVVKQFAKSTNNIGDVELVSSNAILAPNDENEQNNVEEDSNIVENDEETVQTTVEDKNSYFAELRIKRNEMYSKSIETYQKIIDSNNISSEQKSIAIQEIENINETQNAIKIAEELIRLKGFEDVIIYSSKDKVSVIVRCVVLDNSEVAQIQNIVSKEMGVQISNISISNK